MVAEIWAYSIVDQLPIQLKIVPRSEGGWLHYMKWRRINQPKLPGIGAQASMYHFDTKQLRFVYVILIQELTCAAEPDWCIGMTTETSRYLQYLKFNSCTEANDDILHCQQQ